jgi:hypothetical protein
VSADVSERAGAIEQIVMLARRHGLSASDIAAALGDAVEHAPADARWRGILVRVLGYLGGTFIFAGVGVFVALQWEFLNSAARVVVTLGSGLVALVLALMAAREARYEKATTPLLLIAAALEPTGMLVAFNEFGSGGDWRWASLVTTGTMAAQFAALFGRLTRSTPLLLTVIFATLFCWTAFDLLDMDDEVVALCLGVGLLLTAIGLDRRGHGDITPGMYLVGGVGFFYGLFDSVEGSVLEIAFLAVASACVYLAAFVRSRTLLFVSTIAILSYTGYYTGEHFADSVGWPLALIAFGIFMIGVSAVAFRIDRDYVRRVNPSAS